MTDLMRHSFRLDRNRRRHPLVRFSDYDLRMRWAGLVVFLGCVRPPPAVPVHSASPEMQRLFDRFLGDWTVLEEHADSPLTSQRGSHREGRARFEPGPGNGSMIEHYHAHGPNGDLDALVIFSYDPRAGAYQVFKCFDDGCDEKPVTARWEDDRLVLTWEIEVRGKALTLRDTYGDFTRNSFTLVAEASTGGASFERIIVSTSHRA